MAQKKFIFTADADTEVVECRSVDFRIGTVDSGDFGGGTLNVYTRANVNDEWSLDSSYTASNTLSSSTNMAFEYYLELTGSTSPDLIVNANMDA